MKRSTQTLLISFITITTTGAAAFHSFHPPSALRSLRSGAPLHSAKAIQDDQRHEHTLAILTIPHSASARIANEAILERAMAVTSRKVSVVLRANTGGTKDNVSLTKLRRYAGEIYSMAWDTAFGLDEKDDVLRGDVAPIALGGSLKDLIVYPQNLPNTPPEGWIVTRPDLSCIVSHDSITGWVTNDSAGSGMAHARKKGQGFGGLASHVDAVNAERAEKGLNSLVGIHVDDWPVGADIADDPNIVFLEDEDAYGVNEACDAESEDDKNGESSLMGGPKGIPPNSLFNSVCVGGTFDGLHYGHRKLLTLAISSVQPVSGKLLIGVTCDEMLVNKAFSDRIPPLNKRIDAVLDFVRNLAPGMQNRIRCISISDEFGPPGRISDFDALVCSHETLLTGKKLNRHRETLGMKAMKLLCTQRTEPHSMSSTAMRRMRRTKDA